MTKPIEVRNPRNGKFDYVIVPPPPKLLSQQCQRLRRGQIQWQKLEVNERISVLKNWKQSILSEREQISESLVSDTGNLSTSTVEIDSLISNIDKWCNVAPSLLQDTAKNTLIPFIALQQTAVPYPLVGIISPANSPLLLSTIDVIPALLAGCAVIVKPSEVTPRFIAPLMNTVNNTPQLKEVLAFVEGAGQTGTNLIEEVDLICFTGSLYTGRLVAELAAENFIPAYLELGGKDPAIVLESADINLATSAILWSAVFHSGQCCNSIERIYVADRIFYDFYHQLIAKAHNLQLAYPTPENGQIGPIISEKQAAIINEHLQDAISKGAIIHCGGKVEEIGGGWWCRPTVITEVNHTMKIMTEETFGPIMPVMSFNNIDEAIELANDSIYGLSAAVFAESVESAIEIAQEINAGTISINDAGLSSIIYEGEKTPFNFSGLGGSRSGSTALRKFLRKKTFLIKTNSNRNSWWFNDGD